MNILQQLYPEAYAHFEKISKEEFKGMLHALLDIDEVHGRYTVSFGLKVGTLFEKYCYCHLSDFNEIPALNEIGSLIKQKMEQRGKHDVA